MPIEDIEYQVDGNTMIGHLAVDDSKAGKRPAVLVFHEGLGLDDHAKSRVERLAGLGFVAFALDYCGGGKPIPLDEATTRLGPLMATSTERAPSDGRATTTWLGMVITGPARSRSRALLVSRCAEPECAVFRPCKSQAVDTGPL